MCFAKAEQICSSRSGPIRKNTVFIVLIMSILKILFSILEISGLYSGSALLFMGVFSPAFLLSSFYSVQYGKIKGIIVIIAIIALCISWVVSVIALTVNSIKRKN